MASEYGMFGILVLFKINKNTIHPGLQLSQGILGSKG